MLATNVKSKSNYSINYFHSGWQMSTDEPSIKDSLLVLLSRRSSDLNSTQDLSLSPDSYRKLKNIVWDRDESNPEISLYIEIIRLLYYLKSVGIKIPQQDQVFKYLINNPALLSVIGEIAGHLSRNIQSAEITFEKYEDPEIDDEHFVFFIRKTNYDDNTMKEIYQIREKLSKSLQNAKGKVFITTDFQPAQYVTI